MPRPFRTIRRCAPSIVALALLGSLLAPVAQAAVTRKAGAPNSNPSGLLQMSPAKLDLAAPPGVPTTISVTLTNDSPAAVDVTLVPTDLGPSHDPAGLSDPTQGSKFGAGTWLKPEVTDVRIAPWETVNVPVRIDVPATPPIGTNLAGITVQTTSAQGAVGARDASGVVRVQGLLQYFLNVPGPVRHDLTITKLRTSDSFVYDGSHVVTWDIAFRNDGTVNETLTGTATVSSMFGNKPFTQKIDQLTILRGATRTMKVTWRHAPPIGAFRMNIKVKSQSGAVAAKTGDRIWFIPWWLPVLLVAALVIPWLWVWWRRRQEWMLYLEHDDHDWQPPADSSQQHV